MKVCERCGKKHNGVFGSGRFCSRSCSNTRTHSKKTKEKIRKSVLETTKVDPSKKTNIKCDWCGHGFLKYKSRVRKRNFCSTECNTLYFNENSYLTDGGIDIIRNTAKNNKKFGGNRNNHAYGWYKSKFAGKVWLESSYEYKVATELDLNDINWERPKPLKYKLRKKVKRYYPDFYLIEYDIYLDPKNDFLIKKDESKIKQVIKENNVNVLVLDKDNLCWKDIKNKLS